MQRALRIIVAAGLLVVVAGLLAALPAGARGGKKKNQAVMVMKVGETRQLDGRHYKSPRIQHPGIVKLERHGKARGYLMRALRRGVTFLSFKAPISPHPKGKKAVKVKIIVR